MSGSGRGKSVRAMARRGFTLVEVLIVVVILGILAATVLPQFSAATDDARESSLKQNLQQMRTQIDMYRTQHHGVLPAAGSTAEADFLKAMLLTTNANGTLGTGADLDTGVIGTGPYGPYVLGQIPANAVTNATGVTLAATNPKNGNTAWWYNPATGEFGANMPDTALSLDGTTKLNSL